MEILGRNASAILWSLAALLIMLILLFGVLHLAAKYTPSPLNHLFDKLSQYASNQAY